MSYLINKEIYKKKSDIISRVQNIISVTNTGDEINGENYDFILGLLKNHDEWEHKTSNGFLGITVGKSIHGTTCFYIKTNDGLEDISFHHAVKCLKNTQ